MDFPSGDTTITIGSRRPFKLLYVGVVFMHPPFRREDGMIHYLNPALGSHPEPPGFGLVSRPHHRKFGGGGKDVAY